MQDALAMREAADRRLRDVLAFAALPAAWIGWDRRRIAESLADAFQRALAPDLVHVALRPSGGHPAGGRSLRASGSAPPGGWEAMLGDPAEPLVSARPLAPVSLGGGFVALCAPVGPEGAEGDVVLVSSRAGFPDEHERLLAQFGANQAGTLLRAMRLDEDLAASRREVAQREKLAALGSLVSGVAHEIRTPLAYATNHLEVARVRLARQGAAPQEETRLVRECVEGALEGMDRIHRIVQQLRRFARLPLGHVAPADFSETVQEAIRLFRATHAGGTAVVADLRARTRIPLDRLHVQQVVLNLLENAADAMRGGGVVHVATRESADGVVLEVRDEGPGIPPEVQARLFEPFHTTKEKGTGLGLSIVRRLVEANRGSIRFETRPGAGTSFFVAFPRAPERKAPAQAPAEGRTGP